MQGHSTAKQWAILGASCGDKVFAQDSGSFKRCSNIERSVIICENSVQLIEKGLA